MKISDVSKYRVVRERATKLVDLLAEQPDYTLTDKSGLLTKKVTKMLPKHLILARTGKVMEPSGMNAFFVLMEGAGWIKREVNGKRTYKMTLIDFPEDWAPPVDPEADEKTQVEYEEVWVSAPTTTTDDGLDGRPGRLAARLEKNIPELVEQGVTNAIFTIVSKMFPQSVPEVDTAELDKLHDIIEKLNHELSAEKLAGQVVRENYNSAMKKSGAVYESSPIRPAQLEKSVQPLARHAIENGWTIHRTNGGHIMFRSPEGKAYFHGSTSSDTRSVANAAADMTRMGMPKL